MTPSTVKAGFISAVPDAAPVTASNLLAVVTTGYSAAAVHSNLKVAEIQKQIPAGHSVGIALNSLHINPRWFAFQLPLCQEMRKEGLPIEGFCVVTGISTIEKAVETFDSLKAAGI